MRDLLRRIAYLVRHRRMTDELAEELDFHRSMKQRELEARGLSALNAAGETRRSMGNEVAARERSRDVWVAPWLQDLAADVRFAARLAARDRLFTCAVVGVLAVGIGANTAVFTLFNAAFLRGLPVEEPDRIVAVSSKDARSALRRVSYRDYQDWRAATRAFTALVAFHETSVNVGDDRRSPERLMAAYISAATFAMLGERPEAGRDLVSADDEPGAPPVAILSSEVWASRYGGDPGIIGRSIRVNGIQSVVVGIMPSGFQYPTSAQMWLPLGSQPGIHTDARDTRSFGVAGRLAKGVSMAQAQADLDVITGRLARDHSDTNAGIGARVMPFTEAFIGGPLRLMFTALMALVGFVLLIACANVANLLLGRSTNRSREMAIRASLGASRARIVRQLLVESVLLALAGGAAGLWIARFGVRQFADFVGQFEGKPYWIQFTMDAGVFAFLAAVCVGTGIVFGLAPAIHVARTNLAGTLNDAGRAGTGGRGVRRLAGALVTVELALTIVLLAGAGLLFRTALAHSRVDSAFDTSSFLTMRLQLPASKYPAPGDLVAFHHALNERLEALPAVESATIASALPLGGGRERELAIEARPHGREKRPPLVLTLVVGPDYFRTLRIPLLRGRGLVDADGTPGHENVVVNERFAAAYFGGDSPIGRRIRVAGENAPGPRGPWLTIVGVAPTIRQRTLGEPEPIVYLPFRHEPAPGMALVVSSKTDASTVASQVREQIRALDADLPVFAVMTMDRALDMPRWPGRFFRATLTIFAAIGLMLSASGVYAVTAYAVGRRTREIGIRLALGARRGQVYRLVVSQVVVQFGLGLALGLAGSIGVGALLRGFLYQTSAADPVTLAGISVLLALTVVAACLAPAKRAARLDPVVALRTD